MGLYIGVTVLGSAVTLSPAIVRDAASLLEARGNPMGRGDLRESSLKDGPISTATLRKGSSVRL